ncbi:MAG TPA: phosphotriesterase [Clostridiaceae bacterium]|nr:phosphotriesterase [Clostridiaceae bacterium]
MSFIRTISGDILPDQLGFTYSHEHIVCSPPYWIEQEQDDLLLDDKEKSLLDVQDLKNVGVKTIVDATCVDYGRDILAVKEISDRTGMQVIATAGFNKGFLWSAKVLGENYTFYEKIENSSIDDLVKFIVSDVEEGIGTTGIRCGQIKFGTGYNSIHPLELKVLKAAARAHLITKAPLHSHTEAGTMALEQIEYLKKEGINLEYISFGHMDRNLDPWIHNKIAENGSFLCFDGIGKIKYAPESERIKCILELVKQGYEEQILISGDFARKSYFSHYGYGPGYKYIVKTWIPRFKEEADRAGLDSNQLINKFFVENPKRCLSFKI